MVGLQSVVTVTICEVVNVVTPNGECRSSIIDLIKQGYSANAINTINIYFISIIISEIYLDTIHSYNRSIFINQ